MAVWNSVYAAIPRDGVNPGYGAQSIRDLKSAVTERMNGEHIWGVDETDVLYPETGGTHREGSARAYVVADGSYASPTPPAERLAHMVASATGRVGQVVVDMSVLASHRMQNEIDLVVTDSNFDRQHTQDIYAVIPELTSGGTWDHSSAPQVVKVFSAQEFTDLISDQVVRGIKNYVHSPLVPDVGVTDTLSGVLTGHFYDPDDSEKLTNAGEIKNAVTDAKYMNLFDPTDQDNIDAGLVVDGSVNRSIDCTSIKGTVWTA